MEFFRFLIPYPDDSTDYMGSLFGVEVFIQFFVGILIISTIAGAMIPLLYRKRKYGAILLSSISVLMPWAGLIILASSRILVSWVLFASFGLIIATIPLSFSRTSNMLTKTWYIPCIVSTFNIAWLMYLYLAILHVEPIPSQEQYVTMMKYQFMNTNISNYDMSFVVYMSGLLIVTIWLAFALVVSIVRQHKSI